mgnify:FL=1
MRHLLTFALLAAFALPDTCRIAASGNGTRYHLFTCSSLSASTLVYRASAESLGYSRCLRCFPSRAAKLKRLPRVVGAR